MSSQTFLDMLAQRQSHYQLKAESTIPDSRIQEIIESVILNVPSAFNSQTTRVILLLHDEHRKLWDIIKDVLKGVVPEDLFPVTEKKLNGFQGAYGTILFFHHQPTVQDYQVKFPLYADKLPAWAVQTDGMHQLAVWVALDREGLGVNLQHYNPLIDAKVAKEWGISEDWVLSAQMVFGTPTGTPKEKTFSSLEERFRVFGA